MNTQEQQIQVMTDLLDSAFEVYAVGGAEELAKYIYNISEPDARQLLFGALRELLEA